MVRRLYSLILVGALIAKQLIKMCNDWSVHCPTGYNKAAIINTWFQEGYCNAYVIDVLSFMRLECFFFSLFIHTYIHLGIFNLFKSMICWFRNTNFLLLRANELKHPDLQTKYKYDEIYSGHEFRSSDVCYHVKWSELYLTCRRKVYCTAFMLTVLERPEMCLNWVWKLSDCL